MHRTNVPNAILNQPPLFVRIASAAFHPRWFDGKNRDAATPVNPCPI
ncbi:hypothetical protein [Edaphobacter modestus]|nr:hypothetical protein [Edaphobacter modestus]